MYQRRLKSFVIPLIYSVACIAFITTLFFLKRATDKPVFNDDGNDYIYVTKDIFGDVTPVISQDKVIIRPYSDTTIKVVKYFYDYQTDAEKQKQSLIYYENTYIQNSGVDYSGSQEKFDVLAILDGTVINVNEDNLLGKIIEVRHTNDLISVYQSLSEINVKKGDSVKQGAIIGKSGTANIATSLKDHLHIEIIYKGKVTDPEKLYDKAIKEL